MISVRPIANENVNLLMEEYINYGLSVMEEKIQEDEMYFYNNSALLDMFRLFTAPETPLPIAKQIMMTPPSR